MKIHELEIQNVRGIRSLTLRPGGEAVVIWGPNGSGKSTVVDAIDFLLTGRIGRLTGRGTGDLSLRGHGAHIDADPEEAFVRGLVSVAGFDDLIEIRRCIARPGRLEGNRAHLLRLKAALEHAARRQHVLTRREILQYITAEPSERAERVQAVLNLSDIETLRARLVTIRGGTDRTAVGTKSALSSAQGAVAAAASLPRFEAAQVLLAINQHRMRLGGNPLQSIEGDALQADIRPPAGPTGAFGANQDLLQQDLAALRAALEPDAIAPHVAVESRLRQLLDSVRVNPLARRAAAHRRLFELGLELLDDSGACPLCGTEWPPGELHETLRREIAEANAIALTLEKIEADARSLREHLRTVAASGANVVAAAASLYEEGMGPAALASWVADLEALGDVLDRPLDAYTDNVADSRTVKDILSHGPPEMLFEDISERARGALPSVTPEQTAWDNLTRISVTLEALQVAEQNHEVASLAQRRAELLLHSFTTARDGVLAGLYDSVRDRFVELYRSLHGDEEAEFSAELRPDGAALHLAVDFHGRGVHPPHALHSEGHQDSMGLCLFLALSERLASGLFDLVILDDVVMSVDADHRRQLSNLLPIAFPGKQFLITTHDRTWANQLKSNGVVNRRTWVEFYNWTLEAGPHVHDAPDQWERIEQDLASRDVSAAAAKLRRGAEEFFATLCERLEARVPYRPDGRYDLGTLLPAAFGRYKELLKEAKKAAQTWQAEETIQQLEELQSTSGQIYQRTNAEQWAVNASIHYSAWADLAPEDFRPVVEAFRDLFDHIRCGRCDGLLRISKVGAEAVALGCPCAQKNFTLARRSN